MDDAKKLKILECFKTEPSISLEAVASVVKLSCEEVKELVNQLCLDGVLLSKFIVLSSNQGPNQEDEKVRAIIEVHVRPEKEEGYQSIAEKISMMPYVVDHYLVSGKYDFLLLVEGGSIQGISSVVSEIASLEAVRHTATYFVLKCYKSSGICLEFNRGSKVLPVLL